MLELIQAQIGAVQIDIWKRSHTLQPIAGHFIQVIFQIADCFFKTAVRPPGYKSLFKFLTCSL